MSAFFVGTDHVDAILSFVNVCLRRQHMPTPSGKRVDTGHVDALTEIGKSLLSENIKSLQERYPSDWQELVDLDVNAYSFTADVSFAMRRDNAISAMKLCDCLAYQSCEHDEWEDSFAKRFLDYVKDSAIGKIPGYEAAPWHYDRPADAPQLVRIM